MRAVVLIPIVVLLTVLVLTFFDWIPPRNAAVTPGAARFPDELVISNTSQEENASEVLRRPQIAQPSSDLSRISVYPGSTSEERREFWIRSLLQLKETFSGVPVEDKAQSALLLNAASIGALLDLRGRGDRSLPENKVNLRSVPPEYKFFMGGALFTFYGDEFPEYAAINEWVSETVRGEPEPWRNLPADIEQLIIERYKSAMTLLSE